MTRIILLAFSWITLYSLPAYSQDNYEGQWLIKDLDNSIISLYKATDGYYYSKILKSENTFYNNQIIFKGTLVDSKNLIDGTFITPKSKMKIKAKIYADSKDQIRMVGKKYFITKTYICTRIK